MANVEEIVPVQQMMAKLMTVWLTTMQHLHWMDSQLQNKTRPESYKRISTGRVVQDDMNAPLWSETTGMYKSKNSSKDLHSQTWY